jgi:hypothetical protein
MLTVTFWSTPVSDVHSSVTDWPCTTPPAVGASCTVMVDAVSATASDTSVTGVPFRPTSVAFTT